VNRGSSPHLALGKRYLYNFMLNLANCVSKHIYLPLFV
jgi:hypothetical protein